MKKIAFIAHTKVRQLNKLFGELQQTFSGSYQLHFYETQYAGHAVTLACEAVLSGATYIICIGGDGSMNEVANGVMKAMGNGTPRQPVFVGLLPNGTGNDFAKTVCVTKSAIALKQYIDAGQYKPVDLGKVSFVNPKGEAANRYFINITDIGMGGVAAERISGYSKFGGATFTFQRAIISTLLTYKRQVIEAVTDTFSYKGEVLNFIIANGKYFGSGLGIAPTANAGDGLFSVVVIGKVSLLDYLMNLGTVRKCRPLSHPQVQYHTATTIAVNGTTVPQAIDMDGEFIGYSPMQVSMAAGALNFLCPATA